MAVPGVVTFFVLLVNGASRRTGNLPEAVSGVEGERNAL